jgi:hypothetical protein
MYMNVAMKDLVSSIKNLNYKEEFPNRTSRFCPHDIFQALCEDQKFLNIARFYLESGKTNVLIEECKSDLLVIQEKLKIAFHNINYAVKNGHINETEQAKALHVLRNVAQKYATANAICLGAVEKGIKELQSRTPSFNLLSDMRFVLSNI